VKCEENGKKGGRPSGGLHHVKVKESAKLGGQWGNRRGKGWKTKKKVRQQTQKKPPKDEVHHKKPSTNKGKVQVPGGGRVSIQPKMKKQPPRALKGKRKGLKRGDSHAKGKKRGFTTGPRVTRSNNREDEEKGTHRKQAQGREQEGKIRGRRQGVLEGSIKNEVL